MGVIPTLETHPGAVPNTAGGLPRANLNVPMPQDAGPTIAGAAMQTAGSLEKVAGANLRSARAFGEVADFSQAFADKYIAAKMEVDASDQSADLSKKLSQVQFDASKIADRDQATAAYDQGTAKVWDDYASGFSHPLVRAKVQAQFTHENILRRSQTQNAAFQLESQDQRGKLITQLDGYTKSASETLDPLLRDQQINAGMSAIDGRVAGGWLNPEAGAKAKVDFKSNVLRTQVELAMAKDPRLGVELGKQLMPGMNAEDSKRIGIAVEDQSVELKAEGIVNKTLPVIGGGGLDNNVGNITASGAPYSGGKTGVGTYAGNPLKFETFASPEHGVAAAYGLIKTKVAQAGGSMTFAQLVSAWDPPASAEVKANYASALAKAAGLSPGDNVPISDTEKMAAVVKGMNRFEKGKQTVPDEAFSRGVKMALGDTSIQPTPAQTGDELNRYRSEGLRAIQAVEADTTMDPRIKSRVISQLNQRLSTTQSLVLSDRKGADDDAEAAAQKLFTGGYVDGTFGKLEDRYRASGDNSKAELYGYMAQNESMFKDFASATPGQQRTMAHLLPGAAGKIAQSIVAEGRVDRTEMRKEAVRQHDLFTKGMSEGLDPSMLVQNAKDAVAYYSAAGDRASAKNVMDQFQGMVQGKQIASLPTVQAENELRRMKEMVDSGTGLSARDSAIMQTAQKGIAAGRELQKNDPMTWGEQHFGKLVPLTPNMSGTDLNLWANRRADQATKTALMLDPTGSVKVPMLTASEISNFKTTLASSNVQKQQGFIAEMAHAMPPDQVHQIAKKIAGDGPQADAWATAMAFYKRDEPGDRQMADSLLAGVNQWQKGGPEGKQQVDLGPQFFTQVGSQLGTAYRGEPEDRATQNNAIGARYVYLMGQQGKIAADKTPDTTTLNQAVKDVVGTSMSYHGAMHLLPSGVEDWQFRDAIGKLNATDMPPIRPTAEGQPIDIDRVRRYATYQAVGDGIYRVWMPDPKQGGTHELVRADTGKPWELSIRPLVARTTNDVGAGSRMQDNLQRLEGIQ